MTWKHYALTWLIAVASAIGVNAFAPRVGDWLENDPASPPASSWNGEEWVPLTCEQGPTVTIDGLVYGGSICGVDD